MYVCVCVVVCICLCMIERDDVWERKALLDLGVLTIIMRVYMCVYGYPYMHACVNLYIHSQTTHTRTNALRCMFSCKLIGLCIYVCIHVHIAKQLIRTHARTALHVFMQAWSPCKRIYTHNMHIYIYIYIYTHTHTHTYIHTQPSSVYARVHCPVFSGASIVVLQDHLCT
jgi:hypothetical protein